MGTKTKTQSATREGGHVLEMQRRRLLLAYTEVLAEHGWQDASVDRICKRAGVSRRTFYDLFLDREGCFLAAFELGLERIAAHVVPAYMSKGEWQKRVRVALTTLLELFDQEPPLARMCVVETLKGGPAVLERRWTVVQALVTAIDEGRTREDKAKGHTGSGESKGSGPPPLTAEGAVGGVLSVIHTRLRESGADPLLPLVNPLMSMIVHPYLGSAAAARELAHPAPAFAPKQNGRVSAHVQDPFKDLPIRITFRTARVLAVMGAQPGSSNREIGDAAGVTDQGQISKLLRRLERSGLASNTGEGHPKGEPNAWTLTQRGRAIQHTIDPPVA
ncbi:MAG TPA: TetR family transcriptional regulator [Solirubrobacteraceae bacterium]